jgi:hypothetical protein
MVVAPEFAFCPIFLMNKEAHVASLKSQKRLSGKLSSCVVLLFLTGALMYSKCSIFHNTLNYIQQLWTIFNFFYYTRAIH